MRKALALVALALVLASSTWWVVGGLGSGATREPAASEDASLRGVASESPAGPLLEGARRPGERIPEDRRTLPPPVDPAAVDRDRDVHGTVVDPSGAPIAGARLAALTRRVVRTGSTGSYRSGITVHGETESAVDGSFRIRLARGASVHLRAEAAGHGTVETPFVAAGARVRVVLGPAVRLGIVVRTESGDPVADAAIRFFQSGGFMVNAPRVAQAFHLDATTNAGGRAVLEALPGEVWGWLEVLHPRWGSPGWTRVTLPAAGEHVQEVVLPAGRVLRGRVTDQVTGKPIPGAIVGAGWVRSRPVTTDADGRYEYPGWTGAGTAEVFAGTPDHVLLGVVVGSAVEVDFALVPGRRARGRVVDPERRPIAGATVKAGGPKDPGGWLVGHATTSADGTFELLGLDPMAEYGITVLAVGFARLSWAPPPPDDPSGPLELGDLVLRPGWRVEGLVRDGGDQPVAGMEVRLGAHPEQRVTDDLGRFRFEGVAAGSYGLRLTGAGREVVEREIRVAEADLTDLEVRVASGRLVEVTVEAEGGAPPQGITLTLRGADGILRHAYPDERGRALLLAPEGEAYLSVSGWPAGWLAPPDRPVHAGEDAIPVVLRRAAPIEGVVRRPDGTPAARASLLIRTPGQQDHGIVTDDEGRFRASVEPGSRADIRFRGLLTADYQPRPAGDDAVLFGEARDVAAGRRDVVIGLEEVATDRSLRVQVLGPEGEPASGVSVTCEGGAGRTDGSGWVELRELPACPLLLTAFPPRAGILAARAVDVVPEGQEIVLRLSTGIVLEGRVVGPSGPVPGASIRAFRGSRAFAFGSTRTDGTFTLTVDPQDGFPIEVRAMLPGDRSREIQVVVQGPPTAPLELRAP